VSISLLGPADPPRREGRLLPDKKNREKLPPAPLRLGDVTIYVARGLLTSGEARKERLQRKRVKSTSPTNADGRKVVKGSAIPRGGRAARPSRGTEEIFFEGGPGIFRTNIG